MGPNRGSTLLHSDGDYPPCLAFAAGTLPLFRVISLIDGFKLHKEFRMIREVFLNTLPKLVVVCGQSDVPFYDSGIYICLFLSSSKPIDMCVPADKHNCLSMHIL